MAEGYLQHAAGGRFTAMSAGIDPKGLNPLAVDAMREIGIEECRTVQKQWSGTAKLINTNVPRLAGNVDGSYLGIRIWRGQRCRDQSV